MGKDYKLVPAVGQMDPTACWAASLSWWLAADRTVAKSQQEIFSMFVGDGSTQVCTADGQINPDVLRDKLAKNYAVLWMVSKEIPLSQLPEWLALGLPVLIGFTTPSGTGHVNVIFDYDKKNNTVQAMEPWFPDLKVNRDGNAMYLDEGAKFTCTIIQRSLGYYRPFRAGNVFVGTRMDIAGVVNPNTLTTSATAHVSSTWW